MARAERHVRAILIALLCTTVSLVTHELRAQERERAEAAFREGRALLNRGAFDLACEKFEESQKLEPSGGTLMNLAACHEMQGKIASAWSEFVAAEEIANREGKASRAKEAGRRANALKSRLSYLTILVPHPLPSLELRRGETLLSSSQIGVAVPIDPGLYRITASAPGHQPATVEVTIAPKADAQTVSIPELQPEPAAVPVEPPIKTPPAPQPLLPSPEPRVESLQPPPPAGAVPSAPVLGWIVGGAGVALVGTGAVFYGLSLSENESATRGCPYRSQYGCSNEAISDESRRDTFATVATVTGVVGLAALGTGAWLLLAPPRGSPQTAQRAPRLAPVLAPGAGALLVRGAF